MRLNPAMVEWFYLAQEALCYLGACPNCQHRRRLMLLRACKDVTGYDMRRSADRFKGGFATVEHVLPAQHRRRRVGHLILLACHDCNKLKGAKLPAAADVELALSLGMAWAEICEPKGRIHRDGLASYRRRVSDDLMAEAEEARALIGGGRAR